MANRVAIVIKDGKLVSCPDGDVLTDNVGALLGVKTFLALTDTPSSYVASKLVAVNAAGNALELISPGGGGDMYASTYDPTGVAADAFSQDNMVDGTTNKNYTATEQSKLGGVEALADVTDATNVDAAGATMNTDTDVSANGWVIDEDDMGSNLNTKVPTQQSVKAYCDALIGANDAMTYKGVIDASTNPDYPLADAGDTYKISVAGKVGGASGKVVEVGDMIICTLDGSPPGDEATVGTNWNAIQVNIDGAVTTTDSSSTDGNIVVESGTSGKVHVEGSKTIAELDRKRYTYVKEFYLDGVNELSSANVMDIVAPYGGYLVASSIKLTDTCTAGTMTVKPHANGVGITPAGLDLSIESTTNTIKDYGTVAYGTADYDVAAGDAIGVLITTSGFIPAATKATVTIIIEG